MIFLVTVSLGFFSLVMVHCLESPATRLTTPVLLLQSPLMVTVQSPFTAVTPSPKVSDDRKSAVEEANGPPLVRAAAVETASSICVTPYTFTSKEFVVLLPSIIFLLTVSFGFFSLVMVHCLESPATRLTTPVLLLQSPLMVTVQSPFTAVTPSPKVSDTV